LGRAEVVERSERGLGIKMGEWRTTGEERRNNMQ
jgi:hypothetical protein